MSSYGPPGSAPPPAAGPGRVDLKSINPLDLGIVAGAVLALIFSFFKYYDVSLSSKGKASIGTESEIAAACKDVAQVATLNKVSKGLVCDGGVDRSAWHGFFGWFGVLLLLVAAGVTAAAIFAPQVKGRMPNRVAALVAAGIGLLCTIIALFVVPFTLDRAPDSYLDKGHGFSFWIVLILAIIVTALAFLRFQQTGGDLRNPLATPGGSFGGGYGAPQPPAPGYGAPQPPAPPAPGYGTSPAPGYGTPQAPAHGYGTPQPPAPGYGTPQPPQGGYPPPPPAG